MNPPPPPTLAHLWADAGHFDELHAAGAPREPAGDAPLAPAWDNFLRHLGAEPQAQLNRRAARLKRQLRDNEVTYNVHADEAGLQRPWPLNLFPLLVAPADWARIEAGVLQRVRVLDAIMADVYGARRLLTDGLIPAALVQGHPDYLRAMHGAPAVGGMHLHIVAFDLARDPHGHWWVVSQRTQAPSGLGYLLENRLAVSGQFDDAFEAMRVRRLAATYRRFIEALKAMAPGGADAHIALLTPGPYNETYFEHAYLARYLGVTLAEGSDLAVRGQRLYLKTLHGLQPVHGLIKRVDDAYLDPLEMRPDSRLGVPGLLQAARAGHVLVANAPGAGFLESSALLGFLPALSRHLLGQELLLPSLHTWWCGEPAAMNEVLPRLDRCVIKSTYPWATSRGTFTPGVGPLLRPEALAAWRQRIRRAPEEHTVQDYLPPSQMPTWAGQGAQARIQPRAAILRVFALADGAGSWSVLPGGMTRLVSESAGLASMALGGSSADTWVLGDGPVEAEADPPAGLTALTPASIALVRREHVTTSRAAENLFWLGRYTERADNSARLAAITLHALHGEEAPSHALLDWLDQLSVASGLVPPDGPAPLAGQAAFERRLIDGLAGEAPDGGVGHTLRCLRQAAGAVRERLSPELWNLIKQAQEHFWLEGRALRDDGAGTSAEALAVLAQLSRQLAAVTGAQHDRMWRDDGWRLLTLGRYIERLLHLSEALSRGFHTHAVHDAAGHAALLELFDSTLSFHARHQRSRAIAALIEHLVLSDQNPRSLGWVVQALQSRLARLRARQPGTPEAPPAPLRSPMPQELPLLCQADANGDFAALQALLAQLLSQGAALSEQIAQRHFRHTADTRRSLGA